MAMLAERKIKRRFSRDPRNSAWLNDSNKFGERMLKEMGWTKGKGLGANEDGNPEFVKLNVKEDSKGVGFTANDEDKWIAHQDDFNKLLNDLNQAHSTCTNTKATKEGVRSLEKQSKLSKKRVHYHKFTRGKDLSLATRNDLACILGNRSSLTDSTVQLDGQEVKSVDSTCHEEAGNEPLFTSTMSLQDYFAKKMDEMKKKLEPKAKFEPKQSQSILSDKTVNDSTHLPELFSTDTSVPCTDAPVLLKKKKKKKLKTQQNDGVLIKESKSTKKRKKATKRVISKCHKSKEGCSSEALC